MDSKLSNTIESPQNIILEDKNAAFAYYYSGINKLTLCNYEAALKDFAKAIERFPYESEFYYQSGNCCYQSGNITSALNYYLEATKFNVKNPVYHYSMALIFYKQNNLDKAAKVLNVTIKLSPDFFLAYQLLVDILMKKGLKDEAARMYRQALELSADEETHYMLGSHYKNLNPRSQNTADMDKNLLNENLKLKQQLNNLNEERGKLLKQNEDSAFNTERMKFDVEDKYLEWRNKEYSLTNEINQLNALLQKHEETIHSMNAQLNDIYSQNTSMQSQYDKIQNALNYKEQDLNDLKNKNKTLTDYLIDWRDKYEALQAENCALSENISAFETTIKNLLNEKLTLESQLKAKYLELRTLEYEIGNITKMHNGFHEYMQKLSERIANLDNETQEQQYYEDNYNGYESENQPAQLTDNLYKKVDLTLNNKKKSIFEIKNIF